MIRLFVFFLLLTGCTASIQPLTSSYSKEELNRVIETLQANDRALAEAIVKLQPKEEQKMAKKEVK